MKVYWINIGIDSCTLEDIKPPGFAVSMTTCCKLCIYHCQLVVTGVTGWGVCNIFVKVSFRYNPSYK